MSGSGGRRAGDYSEKTRTILEWMKAHPDGVLADCARDLGIHYGTVKSAISRYGHTLNPQPDGPKEYTLATLPGTVDEAAWAAVFIGMVRDYPELPTNEEAMRGWFASAIAAGRNEALKRKRGRR